MPPALPAIVDAADFVAAELTEPAALIAGVLHQGSKLVIGGGSKSFKTWTLLDLALSVSHGGEWLGNATAKGQVLFLNFEIQSWSIQRRIAAIATAKGITIERGQLSIMNLRGKAGSPSLSWTPSTSYTAIPTRTAPGTLQGS